MIVGILGLQGDVIEHYQYLARQVKEVRIIKRPKDLSGIQGLVLPGGESTTISKLIVSSGLDKPVRDLIGSGLPVWGTCAGVVLLCKGGIWEHVDAEIQRNAYGPQIYSCVKKGKVKGYTNLIPMVFIRAPKIINVTDDIEILSVLDGDIVVARQKNILLTTFHPELTPDAFIIQYFIRIMESARFAL